MLAAGVAWRRIVSVEGFDKLIGKGIYWRGAQRGLDVHSLDVHLIGAGNSAGRAVFANHARNVTLICRATA